MRISSIKTKNNNRQVWSYYQH